MLHIPILRRGKPYESIDKIEIVHHATGDPVAKVSQANAGLICRDVNRMDYAVLDQFKVRELIDICRKAARIFIDGTVPLGDSKQSFEDYVRQLSATTGMPFSYCKSNAKKIHRTLDEIEVILAGLTRGFDLSILDRGFGDDDGRMLSWFREARTFGAVLPSNSPGVHSLWIPAIALKTPIVLKPGREEPWTPLRVIESLAAAGIPREAFGFYPTDHGGSGAILQLTDRSMLFGDASTTKAWAHDPRVEVHGPGYSKIILGADAADNWQQYVDLMTGSIAANGGRSCINASGVWSPKNADAIAHELAQRLARVQPLPADHADASIAAFANPAMAERMNAMIDSALQLAGAVDLTQKIRGTPRLVKQGRIAWLLPTIIRCERDHPLANKEFLFPFASVVECPQDEIASAVGSTLVGTVLTRDKKLIRDVMACGNIDRLNVGPIPTYQLSWDQPHEGNLFEHLYRQRAFQLGDAVPEAMALFP